MTTIFGIKNCDTIKKTRRWLEANEVDYTFQDVREAPLTKAQVDDWIEQVGLDTLINKRGKTWRQLSVQDQERALQGQATSLILANPAMFKRPVVEIEGRIVVGFSEESFSALFLS